MKYCWSLLIICCLSGCKPVENSLTCIALGYDSIVYYRGSSSDMRDIKRGLATDTVFLEELFRTVKDHGAVLTLKPGDGAGVMGNVTDLEAMANSHGISKPKITIIDANEQKAFGI